MTKYQLLILLNLPFIFYGMMKAAVYYREGTYSLAQFFLRLVFWLTALAFVLFAEQIYNYLIGKDLTTSTPLSLADVLLATFSFLSFTLIIRLYTRVERSENKIAELNEELSLRHAALNRQATRKRSA